MPGDDDLVTVATAAAATGISERTLRYWIANGKLPATADKRSKRVRLRDVVDTAALAGKLPAATQDQNSRPGSAAGNAADDDVIDVTTMVVKSELPAVADDRWNAFLRPFLDREQQRDQVIAEQAEEIGRLKAELEQLRATQSVDAAAEGQPDTAITNDAQEPILSRWERFKQRIGL